MTQETTTSTVIWCGTVKSCLTDVEKAILYHEHEAKCNWFFGKYDKVEYHTYMAEAITRMKEYSDRTSDKFRAALINSFGVEGVEVKGDTKEERIEHMKQIFKDQE